MSAIDNSGVRTIVGSQLERRWVELRSPLQVVQLEGSIRLTDDPRASEGLPPRDIEMPSYRQIERHFP